jgi:c-di-GMP-binding flagellar brake protein YcgR
VWISQKKPFRTNFLEEDSVEKEEKETKLRYGTVSFERRKYPRFNIDLPVQYYRMDLSISHNGRAMDVSEGGLLIHFPERMKIGERLKLKLFFIFGSEMNAIEALVEVAWTEIYLDEAWGDYRSGVKFLDISPEDMTNLKKLLRSLSG